MLTACPVALPNLISAYINSLDRDVTQLGDYTWQKSGVIMFKRVKKAREYNC